MKRTCCGIGLIAFLMLFSGKASCRLVTIPDIKKLTADSNLVAVVEVVGVRQLGTVTFIDSQRKPLGGQHMAAVFRLEEILEGETGRNSIEIEYDSNPQWLWNSGPETPSFVPGLRNLVFLPCDAKSPANSISFN